MPAAPKSSSSTTRRQGATKQKGAVRAKSGCYTCRIRRKKCDEQADANSHCTTCVRLRLECLGFGAKRPDWLRDNENVKLLRERIKTFLGAQGMIKGHAASGPRTTDSKGVLRLSALVNGSECDSSSNTSLSSSPPNRREPLPPLPEDDYSRVREPYTHTYGPGHNYPPNDPGHYDDGSQSPESYPNSLVPISPRRSTFPVSYHKFYDENFIVFEIPNENNVNTIPIPPTPWWSPLDQSILHYQQFVVPDQYLLGLRASDAIIADMANKHHPCRVAVQLLSNVYQQLPVYPNRTSRLLNSYEFPKKLEELETLIQDRLVDNNAMAALHAVSVFLFDGGKGNWLPFLQVASRYVQDRIDYRPSTYTPRQVLEEASEKVAFILKTSIWFDVLASVTTMKKPILFNIIHRLFAPDQSGISTDLEGLQGMGTDYGIPRSSHHQPYIHPISTCDYLNMEYGDEGLRLPKARASMLAPMGCENIVVWVLAQISALSVMKETAKVKGNLSIVALGNKAKELEDYLNRPQQVDYEVANFGSNADAYSRYLTSRIFRTSAWLYLHSVISGGFPDVEEIKQGVDATMKWIKEIPWDNNSPFAVRVRKSVVRSTVFAFFICGALTDNERYKSTLVGLLRMETGQVEGAVGNIAMILTYLQKIWEGRIPGVEVDWRSYLRDGEPVLLV